MKIAVFPGSFDPITNGHIDILLRSLKIFDKVIILVACNETKKYISSVEERLKCIKQSILNLKNVGIAYTDGLTVNYARSVGAKYLIRGIRNINDFEYEHKLACINYSLDSSIETIFLMAKKEYAHISSSAINEMFKNGQDISSFVPASVLDLYNKKRKL